MNLIKVSLSIIALILTHYAQAESISKTKKPTKVPISFEKIYVPDDFDSNDNVQIIGEGMYANSCFREAETLVRIDHTSKVVYLEPKAYKYDGMCLMLILPFDRVLNLGVLRVGTYTVIQNNSRSILGQIRVRDAKTNEPDDHMYAPVSQAFFYSKNGTNTASIAGSFPLRCLRIKEIKSHIQKDVIVILPIAEVDRSVPCDQGRYPFETSSDLGSIQPGHYLFHVRSMNGRSINSIVDIY